MRHPISWFIALSAGVILALTGGCCDKKTKRIQSHWLRAGEGYFLQLVSIRTPDRAVRIVKSLLTASSFDDATLGLTGSVRIQEHGFWLDLMNKSAKPIRLVWTEARYIDENAKGHVVFRQPMDPLPHPEKMKVSPAVVVQPGERINDVIAPIYKSYMTVFGCREYTPFREPLVPTTLEGRNEAQMKTYVDDLARRQVPVKLVLPIEIDGIRDDYTFAFVLKERGAPAPKE